MSEPKPGVPGDVLLWLAVAMLLWVAAVVIGLRLEGLP